MGILKRMKRIVKKVLGRPIDDREMTLVEWLRQCGASIGENVDILNSTVDSGHAWLLTIGDNVTITGATVLVHDASIKKELGKTKIGRVKIGSNVFIGVGSVVLPNTVIGNRVIIGSNSVITKDVPDNSVMAGNPAKLICTYEEYMQKHREAMKTAPIYDTPHAQKTEEQKQQQKREVDGIIAYDW